MNGVTAVIPVFNGRDLLASLLDSIALQTFAFEEIVVVDNGSTDGAAELARERGCRVLSQGRNSGFAVAVNRGWLEARTPWVAILNSDVVLRPDWLQHFRAHLSSDGAFLTGKLLQASRPELLDGTFDLLSRAGCAWRAGHGQPDAPDDASAPVRIALTSATACLYRREILAALGGFEESFESYLEDVDLSLRCAAAGWSGLYVPAARATHLGSATFGPWGPRAVRLISRNQVLLVRRHYDGALFRAWWWPILAGQLLWGLSACRHGVAWSWLQGKLEALRGFRLAGTPTAALRTAIEASEAQIHSLATDSYWRLYFRLTLGAH